ncbi:hypothetical protein AX16_008015 [Volvariella volvacea WC 439]|nr:hypothetical protein AX16_008015 [Volvariella volvacea WC 439]
MPSPPSFYAQELQRALSESSWGIKSFAVTASSPLQATAVVTLLEGYTVTITLSIAGYSVDPSNNPGAGQCSPDVPFESIEPLLQRLSSMYERQRQALLFQRLEKLS